MLFRSRHLAGLTVPAAVAVTLGIAGLQHGLAARGAHAAGGRPAVATVTLRDFRVSVSPRQLPAGTPIKFVISNRGKVMHELVLERAGADDAALTVGGKRYEADNIAPGTTRTVLWTVPRAGMYQLACHMPGHFQMGMKTMVSVVSHR